MRDEREDFRLSLVYLKGKERLKITEIAKVAGCTPRHIQGVLSDKEKKGLGRGASQRVSELFGFSYRDMLSMGERIAKGEKPEQPVILSANIEQPNVEKYYYPKPSINIPLISWVQAGEWQFAADPFQPGQADEWIETSATSSENAYALTVHGDSMEPEFREGDIIIIDPRRRAENGSYVIVKNGVEATFKQFVTDGLSVFLKPLNDRYPIRDMTGIEFRIVGVVVEKRKRY